MGANSYNILSVKRVFSHGYFALLASLSGGGDGGPHVGGWDGGSGSGAFGGRLRVLNGLLYGLEEEMATRFAVHAQERAAGGRGGVGGTSSVAIGGRKRSAPETRDEDEDEEAEAEAEEEEGGDSDEDAPGVSGGDDDGEEEEESDGADTGAGGGLFSLRAARKAARPDAELRAAAKGKKRKRGGAGDDAADVQFVDDRGGDAGRSELRGLTIPQKARMAHGMTTTDRDATVTTGRGYVVHPRDMTRKQRRLDKKARKLQRQAAEGDDAPVPEKKNGRRLQLELELHNLKSYEERKGLKQPGAKEATQPTARQQKRHAGKLKKAAKLADRAAQDRAFLVGIGKAPLSKKQRKELGVGMPPPRRGGAGSSPGL